jgi:hypothetical protein
MIHHRRGVDDDKLWKAFGEDALQQIGRRSQVRRKWGSSATVYQVSNATRKRSSG